MRYFQLIFLLHCVLVFKGQNELKNWHFGVGNSLSFSGGAPVFVPGSSINQKEGSSTVNDPNGNLLFYTDGQTVYTKLNNVMANGSGLLGDNSSSTCISLENPGNPDQYYVFTLESCRISEYLRYSIIDMSRQGGLGEVIVKNKELYEGNFAEKMTVVRRCDKNSFWVVIVNANSAHQKYEELLAFLIDERGIAKNPIVSDLGSIHSYDCLSQLKSSISGRWLTWDGGVYYCEFDPESGQALSVNVAQGGIHNQLGSSAVNYYGVEFSSNEKYIYNNYGYRVSLPSGSVETYAIRDAGDRVGMSLQMGPDGKIYGLNKNKLNAITNVEGPVDEVAIADNVVSLSDGDQLGISYFPAYLLDTTPKFHISNSCEGEPITFEFIDSSEADSVKWYFEDGSVMSSNFSTTHIFASPGNTLATLSIFSGGKIDTVAQCVEVRNKQVQENVFVSDTSVCIGNPITLIANRPIIGSFSWNDGESLVNREIAFPGSYSFEYDNGCSISDGEVLISEEGTCGNFVIAEIPNVFSPGEDGFNDTFSPQLKVSREFLVDLKMKIYNRWGIQVYEGDPSVSPWKGLSDGVRNSDGVYFYILSCLYQDERIIQNGYVHLLR